MRLVLLACLMAMAPGCGDNGGGDTGDNEAFDTFQACFDEHHGTESFPAQMAIEICCISHPIGDQDMNVVCGPSATSCETYVAANLTSADATAGVVTAACEDYVVQRSM